MYSSPFWSKQKIDNPRKFQREFEAFEKKFLCNKHEIWFLSLEDKQKWDLLFEWKKHKHYVKKQNTSVSFKKFIYNIKSKRKFRVSKQKLREVTLNKIINL